MSDFLRFGVFPSALVFVVAAACGGPQDSPPAPLSRHFEDTPIAVVPMESPEKKAMLQKQNDYSVAKYEKAKAEADFNESGTQIEVARNEARAAKLDEDSARSQKKAAEASADTNRINEAMRQLRGSESFRKATEQRVRYLEAYRGWLKRLLRYTEENMYWREAQFELAKATVAHKNNIAPKGFKYDDYVKQEAERSRRVGGAKDKAESEKSRALEQRSKWLSMQSEADKVLGKASTFPDPMAPKPPAGTPTDITRGGGGTTIGGGGTITQPPPPPPDDPAGEGSGSATPQ